MATSNPRLHAAILELRKVQAALDRSASPSIRIQLWSGPTGVRDLAAAVQKAGYPAEKGTEHVYVTMPFARTELADAVETLLRDLRRATGSTFGLTVMDLHKGYIRLMP
jgi:hypothetical protein